jgi:large subunit ribosomal protein L6
MSRIGREPIPIPEGVTLEIGPDAVRVKGARGELTLALPAEVELKESGGEVRVRRRGDERRGRALHGLIRTLLANMVVGVTQGWQKQLELVGVGYRAALEGGELVLSLGFSHPVRVKPPEGVVFAVDGKQITVSGIDKALVGQVAANIRGLRKPEPYKGKGIRYLGEKVRRKVGKTTKVGGEIGG